MPPETEFYPYQQIGARFAAGRKRALIADAMGLGKSAQAVLAADLLNAKTVLVVCPAIVRLNWMREFQKFSDRARPFDLMGSANFSFKPGYVQIASYDGIRDIWAEKLRPANPRYDLVILDEAHYLKNWKAARTKAVYGDKCDGRGGLVENAANVIALTGTPMPNEPSELWPMLRAMFPDAIRPVAQNEASGAPFTYWGYVRKFCRIEDNGYGIRIIGGKNLGELKSRFTPHMIRRKVEDALPDLPEIRYGEVLIENPLAAKSVEKHLGREGLQVIMDAIKADDLAGIGTHHAEVRHEIGRAKTRPVIELVAEEFENGLDKIVLFAHHRDVIDGLKLGLQKYGAVAVLGGTPQDERQSCIDRFQTDPACRVFVGQLTAAGTGITLTAASNVLLVETSWTPADNAQAVMRCHRIGQKNSVLARFVTLADSIDEHIQRTLRRKTATIRQIF